MADFMPWLKSAFTASSAGFQEDAQNKALDAQTKSSNDALDLQRQMWEYQQNIQAPWKQAGTQALPELQRLAGSFENMDPTQDKGYRQKNSLTDPGQFSFSTSGPNADPSYQWRLNQGLDSVNKSAAARGGFFSGQTGTDLMNYGQGAASQEYGNQFARYQTQLADYMGQESFNSDQYNNAYNREMGVNQGAFNQFASLAGIGQTAVTQLSNSGQNYASGAGNIAMNQGNNVANNAVSNANIYANATNNMQNQVMGYVGNSMKSNAAQGDGSGYKGGVNAGAILSMFL